MSGATLATFNAIFNASAALFLVLGFRAIRAKRVRTHRRFMLAAFAASCLFLTSYLTRYALYGDTHFQGEGPIRYVYFAILISHILLAVINLPLVLRTLFLGLKMRVASHRRVARFTLPMWGYVSVTGVVVYLMLYHWP